MRLGVALLPLLLAGCGKGGLTIPAGSIDRYAAGQTVTTAEGPTVSLADRGALQPIAADSETLTVISRQSVEWEGGTRDMIYLGHGGAEAAPAGGLSVVRDVEEVQAGKTLTILGKRSGVRVNSAYVGGIRVIGSKQNPRGLSGGAIAGITVGALAGAALIGAGIYGLTQLDLGMNLSMGL